MKATLMNMTRKILICMSFAFLFLMCADHAAAKPGDGYSADKAAAYADSCFKKSGGKYVAKPNKKYGTELCAGFVSQCLKEGGMTMDSDWYWKSKSKKSRTWYNCSALYSYLRKCKYKINYSPTEDDVQKGDVIFYYTGGRWGHVAICVGKKADGTPIVDAYNNAKYHHSNWTMNYKTCVVSMESRTSTPVIEQSFTENGISVSISCNTSGAAIYYTIDGKNPSTDSTKYTKPFTLNKNCTVKAIAAGGASKISSTAKSYIDIGKTMDSGIYYLQNIANTKLALGIKDTAFCLMQQKSEKYDRKFQVTYRGKGHYNVISLDSNLKISENPAKQPQTDEKNNVAAKKASTEKQETAVSSTKTSTSAGETVVDDKASAMAATSTMSGTLYQTKLTRDSELWNISFAGKNRFYISNYKTSHYLTAKNNPVLGGSVYMAADKSGKNAMWKLSPATTSNLKVKLYRTPKKEKNVKYLTLSGMVTSNYKIESANIAVQSLPSKKTVRKKNVKPNSKKVSLYELSHKMSCKGLKAGRYNLIVTACDASGQTTTIVKKQFKIVK